MRVIFNLLFWLRIRGRKIIKWILTPNETSMCIYWLLWWKLLENYSLQNRRWLAGLLIGQDQYCEVDKVASPRNPPSSPLTPNSPSAFSFSQPYFSSVITSQFSKTGNALFHLLVKISEYSLKHLKGSFLICVPSYRSLGPTPHVGIKVLLAQLNPNLGFKVLVAFKQMVVAGVPVCGYTNTFSNTKFEHDVFVLHSIMIASVPFRFGRPTSYLWVNHVSNFLILVGILGRRRRIGIRDRNWRNGNSTTK